MKKPSVKILNTILAIGLLFIFVGFLFIVGFSDYAGIFVYSLFPIIICFAGVVFLYIYMGFSKTPFKLFVGLALTLNGIFWLIITRKLITLSSKDLWPVFVIITAASLFIAGRTKCKKFIFSYDLTALILLLLGSEFLLFSLGIIKFSFSQIAVISAPIILILSGIFLVVLFFKRKSILEILPEDVSKELSENNSEDSIEENIEDDSQDIDLGDVL